MGIPSNLLPLYISPMDDDCGLLNFVPSKTDDLHFTPQTSFVPCRANLYHFQLYFVFAIFYMLSACSFHRYLPPAAFRQLSALALMPSHACCFSAITGAAFKAMLLLLLLLRYA